MADRANPLILKHLGRLVVMPERKKTSQKHTKTPTNSPQNATEQITHTYKRYEVWKFFKGNPKILAKGFNDYEQAKSFRNLLNGNKRSGPYQIIIHRFK